MNNATQAAPSGTQITAETRELIEAVLEAEFDSMVSEMGEELGSPTSHVASFCRRYDLPKRSPLALMYCAFIGGYMAGMEAGANVFHADPKCSRQAVENTAEEGGAV